MSAKIDDPRVGILGYGYWGSKWARIFEEAGHLEWIFDTSSDRLAGAQRKYGLDRIAPNVNDRLSGVDGLVIATPSRTHYQLARDAMIAGKDVLVEKPVALSQSQADRLSELAEETESVFLAGHTFTYSHHVHSMRDIIEDGEIGDVQHIRLEWRGQSREREDDVDLLWNLGPHPASVLGLITGTPPTRAEAASGARSIQAKDVLSAWLEYPDGMTAEVSLSSVDPEKQREITVIGSEGWIKCEPTRGRLEAVRKDGKREKTMRLRFEPLEVEAFDFIECLRNRCDPASSVYDALLVTETLEKIRRAARKEPEPSITRRTFISRA